MIKLNRKRIVLVSLGVSVLILAVPAAVSRRVRLAAADLFEPVTSTTRSFFGGIRARIRAFGRGDELKQELEEERRRRQELETLLAEQIEKLALMKRAGDELTELRRLLPETFWRRGLPIAANVIRRPGKWESRELIIDRGASHGVRRRCPVLVGEAVLGVVAAVADDTATVLVLGHPEMAVPARIVETRQQGLVEADRGKIVLNYVVRDPVKPVQTEHTVVTSGLGGVFPPGCLIGHVGPGVVPAEGRPFYDITVNLPGSARNPEVVWVLLKPAGSVRGSGKARDGKSPKGGGARR
ncbi:MAG: rod shape-determining protein MreC [Planctomycetota bacterium]|jgi:rod shape-determining protein MreC